MSAVYRKPTHVERYLNFDQNILYNNNNQWLTLFSNVLKTFLHGPRLEQRNEICETDSHVELLPQMKTKEKEATQWIFCVYISSYFTVHN